MLENWAFNAWISSEVKWLAPGYLSGKSKDRRQGHCALNFVLVPFPEAGVQPVLKAWFTNAADEILVPANGWRLVSDTGEAGALCVSGVGAGRSSLLRLGTGSHRGVDRAKVQSTAWLIPALAAALLGSAYRRPVPAPSLATRTRQGMHAVSENHGNNGNLISLQVVMYV
jgi:hypothetical protein